MTDIARTPAATLTRARGIARATGLHYVYTGNVHDREGGTTYCPHCAAALIVRDWYTIEDYRVDANGTCPDCGGALAGRYRPFEGQYGRRRQRVAIL
jgi:pyruvate formate lyase activating enzyme